VPGVHIFEAMALLYTAIYAITGDHADRMCGTRFFMKPKVGSWKLRDQKSQQGAKRL